MGLIGVAILQLPTYLEVLIFVPVVAFYLKVYPDYRVRESRKRMDKYLKRYYKQTVLVCGPTVEPILDEKLNESVIDSTINPSQDL